MKISAVIPTCEKQWDEGMTIRSMPSLLRKPDEIIVIIDWSEEKVEERHMWGIPVRVVYTQERGAAGKRNLGYRVTEGEGVLFVDDDIELKPNCIEQMEKSLQSDDKIGAVGAFIENQPFRDPGIYSIFVWSLMSSLKLRYFSGRCFGPLINIWPKREANGEIFQQTDWVSIACVLYRKEALPIPPFKSFFQGYSFLEDVTLSTEVASRWKVGMARDALVTHHSKPAPYRENLGNLHAMLICNRFTVLTQVKGWQAAKAAGAITLYELLMMPAHGFSWLKGKPLLPIIKANTRALGRIWRQVFQKEKQ